ncbi:GNAT family N-acetyltransferase [Pseudactinotalea suaedae]|uniref:GNAT family N-acetyltransferase n=1 Tax=Pseudactinotalea suaedae TaxID=1524924 RepID=UPI0012E21F18|nr:GNAT family N-acetyltransferase [Pseudactinotalea suaedae]
MPTSQPYHRVHAIGGADLDAAADLLGRGMADNPVHIAAYRGDETSRALRHGLLMRTLLRRSPSLQIEGVDRGEGLAGIAAWAPPGTCQPTPDARLHLLGRALTFGPGTAARLLTWTRAWARHDPGAPHVHLGPVSVDRHLRGRGIGGFLLLRHVGRLDVAGVDGYLETDRPEAVGFYERFGYAVVDKTDVLGTRCWFMRRRAE